MRLCVGTAKGIVILDPDRGAIPVMVLADPASVWALAQDSADPGLLYAGSMHNHHAGSARGKSAVARSSDGGRTWIDITPGTIRDEDVWAIGTPPDAPGEVFIGTSHARLLHSKDGHSFRECAAFQKLPGRDRWTFPPPPHIPHVRSITFDPHNPDTMYVGVEEGGVFRSRDRGKSFEPLNHKIYPDVHCIVVDTEDSRRLYVTTGRGVYHSNDAGASWTYVRGLSRSYTVPLLVRSGPEAPIYTAAAAGPPPLWSMGAVGADALMFRSEDRGNTFRTIASGDGSTHATRGMIMRIVAAPDNGTLFGVLSDGSVIRVDEHTEEVTPIAEKLPPAYDLAVLP
jgi:photosystem II stability/assembly factor-like uncharacterized protein